MELRLRTPIEIRSCRYEQDLSESRVRNGYESAAAEYSESDVRKAESFSRALLLSLSVALAAALVASKLLG